MTESNAGLLCFDKNDAFQHEQAFKVGSLANFREKATQIHELTIKCVRTSLDLKKNISRSNKDFEGQVSDKNSDYNVGFGRTQTEFDGLTSTNHMKTTDGTGFRLSSSSFSKKKVMFLQPRKLYSESSNKAKTDYSESSSKKFKKTINAIQSIAVDKTYTPDLYSELSTDLLKSHNLDPAIMQSEDVYPVLGSQDHQSSRHEEETIMNSIAENLLKQPDSLLFTRQDVSKVPLQLFLHSGLSQKTVYMGLMAEGKMRATNIEILKRTLSKDRFKSDLVVTVLSADLVKTEKTGGTNSDIREVERPTANHKERS